MNEAVHRGFDLEFDIQLEPDCRRLVLSHDPVEWTSERNALALLQSPGEDRFHALNIKSLYTLPAVIRALQEFGTADRFFLFDFELVTDDLPACRFLMRSVREQGIRVAYRLSEREPFLEQYLSDKSITHIWLDEFAVPWVDRDSVRKLTEYGKTAVYVSPDLHGLRDLEHVGRRWDELMDWGIGGICTDYPLALRLRRGMQDD